MSKTLGNFLLFGAGAVTLQVLAAFAGTADDGFWRENAVAMARMMAAMHVPPSGDVDRDFVAQMTPHHQGAIDMARLELLYGHNETLRRLAQEIIVTQQSEIGAMQLAVGEGR